MDKNKAVDLYTYAVSPYGMKVYWALVFKGLKFKMNYVSPVDFRQISFTTQSVVPVVKIDEEWRLDSGPICCWLDEEFPDRPIAGSTQDERSAIIETDTWVTENLVALLFRTCIDRDTWGSVWRTSRKLARIMSDTSGDIPWFGHYIWWYKLKGAHFIKEDAAKLDRSKPVAESRALVIERMDERLRKTGFLAGTNSPSYADIAAFAQIFSAPTFGFEGILTPDSSPLINTWYREVERHMDLSGHPEMVPGWTPYKAGALC